MSAVRIRAFLVRVLEDLWQEVAYALGCLADLFMAIVSDDEPDGIDLEEVRRLAAALDMDEADLVFFCLVGGDPVALACPPTVRPRPLAVPFVHPRSVRRGPRRKKGAGPDADTPEGGGRAGARTCDREGSA
jgi:hypothetical protein